MDWLCTRSRASFGLVHGRRVAVIVDGGATALGDLVRDLSELLEDQLHDRDVWWVRVDGDKVQTYHAAAADKGSLNAVRVRSGNVVAGFMGGKAVCSISLRLGVDLCL